MSVWIRRSLSIPSKAVLRDPYPFQHTLLNSRTEHVQDGSLNQSPHSLKRSRLQMIASVILVSGVMLATWSINPGAVVAAPSAAIALMNPSASSAVYQHRDRPSSDGIGKEYMGREIAQVMGHRGAAWLERPSRIQEEKPHVLMANLEIEPDDVIADIGAGTGYLTLRLAAQVPEGRVLAVDVQPEMLDILNHRITETEFTNVEPVLATEDNPHLPNQSVDMAIMLDVYHELAYPYEVMKAVAQSLKPGGHVVLVEYRGENPLIPIKRLHKMTERQVRRELQAAGLTWVSTNEDLPRQHLMVFEKATSAT